MDDLKHMNGSRNHKRLDHLLSSRRFILTEAAVIEALERSAKITLDPHVANVLLIYDAEGREVLTRLYGEFVAIAQTAQVPIVLSTPTWRAGYERVKRADAPETVNQDAAVFLSNLRLLSGNWADQIFIGGLMGPKHDAYQPQQGLSVAAAEAYHQWQVDQLVAGGVDFLLAATLPALPEAKGLALAMARSGCPGVLSFVLGPDGLLLDGVGLDQAIAEIDAACARPLAGYMINCAYPSFLQVPSLAEGTLARIIGFQANAACRSHAALDTASTRMANPVADWGDRMIELNQRFGIKILGGCCGTRAEHLCYLVEHIAPS